MQTFARCIAFLAYDSSIVAYCCFGSCRLLDQRNKKMREATQRFAAFVPATMTRMKDQMQVRCGIQLEVTDYSQYD
jgi:hypothetical protein